MNYPLLTASFGEPIWRNLTGMPRISHFPSGYRQEIHRLGGFWSATMDFVAHPLDASFWLDRGLARDVKVYDDALVICWEGFVNTIRVTEEDGGTTTIGPYLDITNKLAVAYTPLIPVTFPPTRLEPDVTAYSSDTTSQALWGIRQATFSGGERTDASALILQGSLLQQRAYPAGTRDPVPAPPGTVSLECLGYVHLLDYPYSQTTNSDEIDLSNPAGTGKLQLLLAGEPNTIFSTDYTRMATNTYAQPAYEEQEVSAWDLTTRMVAAGDSSYNVYNFGIYQGRRAIYEAAPSDIAYVQQPSDWGPRVFTPAGREVYPWNVLPGRWLFYSSFIPGKQAPSATNTDPRFEYIETVTATLPLDLQHEGGRSATVDQVMAQTGLAGVY